jgi:hypothetical protein
MAKLVILTESRAAGYVFSDCIPTAAAASGARDSAGYLRAARGKADARAVLFVKTVELRKAQR